jgi:hypothetical protein
VECLGDEVQVVSVQSCDRDSAITCHVDVAIFLKLLNLISVETGISEHSDLTGDVTPIMSASMILELPNQT